MTVLLLNHWRPSFGAFSLLVVMTAKKKPGSQGEGPGDYGRDAGLVFGAPRPRTRGFFGELTIIKRSQTLWRRSELTSPTIRTMIGPKSFRFEGGRTLSLEDVGKAMEAHSYPLPFK